MDSPRVLFLCYGNPARLDDALGPSFAVRLERENIDGVTVEADYQLSVEDALSVSQHELVVFVDASLEGDEPFRLKRIAPSFDLSFSTHSVDPEHLMGLAERLFNSRALGFALGIRGYCFNEFGESLSRGATENLEAAVRFVREGLGRSRDTFLLDSVSEDGRMAGSCCC